MSKCVACNKGIYPMDPKINLDGSVYHMTCAKCSECNCQITLANFTKVGGGLMCKTHYMKSFKESGGKYLSKAPTTPADRKIEPSSAVNATSVAGSAVAPAKPTAWEVPSLPGSSQPGVPVRPAVAAAPNPKERVETHPPAKPSAAAAVDDEEESSPEAEESSPEVEAEPVSAQFFEEPSSAAEEALSAPAVMSEEEFAAVFESGASLSAAPPQPAVQPMEERETEAVAPPRRSSTRISTMQAELPNANPSRRTKHAIPRPSNDFSDLDYDILTVKTNLIYGYEGEYDAEGKKCGRGIYKYPG